MAEHISPSTFDSLGVFHGSNFKLKIIRPVMLIEAL